ncbi:unnamed protein product [Heligmosomoides polygyrus]|uniref:G_PROTEIN_RECEP_F1_2 domain-containing protein n=1 Tax=Heligmosomoides polygyrus TaxID=6339 RepID=A0A183GRK4_HELPZ|nr:unnamed protein product [Heligmosomoides polygyrus]
MVGLVGLGNPNQDLNRVQATAGTSSHCATRALPFIYIVRTFVSESFFFLHSSYNVLSGILTLVTSLDRFYCVMFPIKYMKQRATYALLIMFSPYVFASCPIIIAVVGSYQYRYVKDENFSMLRIIRVISTLSCVVIYVPIFTRISNLFYVLNLNKVGVADLRLPFAKNSLFKAFIIFC